jgi:hypothetical protein
MTEFQPFAVESLLSRADFVALRKTWGERARARIGRTRLMGAMFIPLLAAAVTVYGMSAGRRPLAFAAFLVGVGGMLLGTAWTSHLFQQRTLPDEHGLTLGRVRMELSSEGVRTLRGNAVTLTQWSALKDVTRTETHLFLWVDQASAYILPLRDLPAGLDGAAAQQRIRGWAGLPGGAEDGQEAEVSPSATTDPVQRGAWQGFLATLARRLTWRRVPADGTASSDAMIFACAVASIAIWLGFDRYGAGPGAEWSGAGLTGMTWYAAGVLALAWALHRASDGTAPFRAVLASIVAGLPLLLLLALAARAWAPAATRGTAYALLGVTAVGYLLQAVGSTTGRRLRPALAATLLALVFAWGTSQAWVYPHLWYAVEGDEDEGFGAWTQVERLLFEQADRIDAAAARLGSGEPGRPDVFFVGFAGVGEQKVFAEEVQLTERVVSERYGAAHRSLLLVNDRRDRETWPLATVHGLRRALARVGERMNPSEDVLFLMLTSHGSDEPSLSVSNGPWPLQQLDGEALRSALDESLIRWRVIVISACHSGAFIEPLTDENTIIITSAAADRSSFGCSDDRDVTDFGAAFIRDALPGALSLADAFDQARERLAERERREGIEPSLPQVRLGSAIRAHWERIERQRAALGTP